MELIELTKVCTKCGERKNWINGFSKCKKSRFGRVAVCKNCAKIYQTKNAKKIKICQKKWRVAHKEERKNYRIENKKRIKEMEKAYYVKHAKKIKIRKKEWHINNAEKSIAYAKAYNAEHSKQCKVYNIAYKASHKEEAKIQQKKYRAEHQEQCKATEVAYKVKHKEKIKIQQKKYRVEHREHYRKLHNQRYKNDYRYKLNHNIRTAISISLRGNKAGRHWETLVNFTLNDLKKHLEKQFTKGMAWENYGRNGWSIDHIIPLSAHNFTQSEHIDFMKAWDLSNLQPMWAKENMIKHAKLEKHFQQSLLLEIKEG